jgi:hypothetical protein
MGSGPYMGMMGYPHPQHAHASEGASSRALASKGLAPAYDAGRAPGGAAHGRPDYYAQTLENDARQLENMRSKPVAYTTPQAYLPPATGRLDERASAGLAAGATHLAPVEPMPSAGAAAGGYGRNTRGPYQKPAAPVAKAPRAVEEVPAAGAVQRSTLLEEFRNNKNRKFTLQVCIHRFGRSIAHLHKGHNRAHCRI